MNAFVIIIVFSCSRIKQGEGVENSKNSMTSFADVPLLKKFNLIQSFFNGFSIYF